jgi:hypothetical protein
MPFASPTAPDICVVGASSFGLGLRKRSGGWRWGWASEALGRRIGGGVSTFTRYYALLTNHYVPSLTR